MTPMIRGFGASSPYHVVGTVPPSMTYSVPGDGRSQEPVRVGLAAAAVACRFIKRSSNVRSILEDRERPFRNASVRSRTQELSSVGKCFGDNREVATTRRF